MRNLVSSGCIQVLRGDIVFLFVARMWPNLVLEYIGVHKEFHCFLLRDQDMVNLRFERKGVVSSFHG